MPLLHVDPQLEVMQRRRLEAHRRGRDAAAVDQALADLVAAARGAGNLLYPMKEALRIGATLGEVSSGLESVFGRYDRSG